MRNFLLALAFACIVCGPAQAQVAGDAPYTRTSSASTNATVVKAGQGAVDTLTIGNTNNTVYYFKFYDKATTPVCNGDPIKWQTTVEASTTGKALFIVFPTGMRFLTGIAFCITAGIASNDNSAISTGVTVGMTFR